MLLPESILCTISVLFALLRFCFQLPIVDWYQWFTQQSLSMMIVMIIDPYQRTDNWEYLCVPLVCNMLGRFLFWYVETNSFSDLNVKPPLFVSSHIFSAGGNAGSSPCALAGLWTPQLSHQMITEDASIEQGPDSPEVKMSKSLMHGRCMSLMHAHDAAHRVSEGNATTVSTLP